MAASAANGATPPSQFLRNRIMRLLPQNAWPSDGWFVGKLVQSFQHGVKPDREKALQRIYYLVTRVNDQQTVS
jgi:hypothetical protein